MKKWNETYEIGNEAIDHHHEEVFELDTKLDTCIQNQNRQELEPIIEFLEHYTVDHFNDEESIMTTHQFHGYDEHKHAHEEFKKDVIKIRSLYNNSKHTM